MYKINMQGARLQFRLKAFNDQLCMYLLVYVLKTTDFFVFFINVML